MYSSLMGRKRKAYTRVFDKTLLLEHLKQVRMDLKNIRYVCYTKKFWSPLNLIKKIYNEVKMIEDKVKFKDVNDMDLYRYKRKLECINMKKLTKRSIMKANLVINQIIGNVELKLLDKEK